MTNILTNTHKQRFSVWEITLFAGVPCAALDFLCCLGTIRDRINNLYDYPVLGVMPNVFVNLLIVMAANLLAIWATVVTNKFSYRWSTLILSLCSVSETMARNITAHVNPIKDLWIALIWTLFLAVIPYSIGLLIRWILEKLADRKAHPATVSAVNDNTIWPPPPTVD